MLLHLPKAIAFILIVPSNYMTSDLAFSMKPVTSKEYSETDNALREQLQRGTSYVMFTYMNMIS